MIEKGHSARLSSSQLSQPLASQRGKFSARGIRAMESARWEINKSKPKKEKDKVSTSQVEMRWKIGDCFLEGEIEVVVGRVILSKVGVSYQSWKQIR